jgi:putative toxin-antitoxin system antitoxin component (TIGR02293 family)
MNAPEAIPGLAPTLYAQSCSYLGGRRYWPRRPANRADLHAVLVGGLPYGSLVFLVGQVKGIDEADVAKVLGLSARTLRRQAETPERPMPPDLASKAWLLAETLARAAEVFGGRDEAERWMSRPAAGLDGQRPVDLMQTLQGAELVADFLTRLEHGVYA